MSTVLLALLLACQALASPPLVGAHRGLGSGEPENTLSAFRASIEAGVDIIELDLRSTSDGSIVVMHDERVDRTTDGHGRVTDLSLPQVNRLWIRQPSGASGSGEHVPTLAQVLPLVRERRTRLLLDIKNGRELDLAEVLRQAKEHGVEDRIVIGVRRLADLRRVQTLAPEATTLAFVPSRAQVDAFIDGGADIVRLWTEWIVADPTAPDAIRRKGRQVWALVGPSVPRDRGALQALHRRAACAGVDTIITDEPGLLLQDR